MRITDADDDYTVTADQRAALMELESLTWNYPTPQHHQTAPPAITTPSTPHSPHYDDDDTDDEDDESYYVELAPYDMTERLKEVNRALVEDPTPAECDRAITVRFREVIADYQSPREYYPSDSDDGYGDSSDLLYDAEEEADDCLTTLMPETLGGNLSVINLVSNLIQDTPEDSSDGDSTNLDVQKNELMKNKLNCDVQGDTKPEVPKLQFEDQHNEADVNTNSTPELISAKERLSYPIPQEESSLLKVDESGLADIESFLRDCEVSDITENLPEEFYSIEPEAEVKEKGESVSLVEVSERVEVERGPKSLDGLETENLKTDNTPGGDRRDSNDVSDTTILQLPAKSESDFVSIEYSDDFEEFPDDEEVGITDDKEKTREEKKAKPNSSFPSSPVHHGGQVNKTETARPNSDLPQPQPQPQGHTRSPSPQKQGHRSRRDLDSERRAGGSSVDRGKKRTESKSPAADPPKLVVVPTPATTRTNKSKRTSATPPMIKPALLNPDKLGSIKPSDQTRHHRSRTSASSSSSKNSPGGSLTSSSASSSSSSSPSSSASSSASSSGSSRGRSSSRGSISSGPVRPTVHATPGVRVPSIPVKSVPSLHHNNPHHTLATTTPGGRQAPQVRVRKAASASDLHNRVREDSEERKKVNDEIFRSWLRRKDKQAAVTKRQHPKSPTGGRGRNSSEVLERRARAEEAFQAWLSRKREQLKLEKRMRGERRRLEDQNRYARSKAECDSAYREWCRRKKDEVRTTARSGGGVPRSQSLERPWVQEKTRKLYSAYLNTH